MSASFKVIREIMQAEAAAKAEAAAGEGRAFLAENAKREGITTLASGLQFEVLTQGEGAKPTREDQVRTHYHGTLIDGTVFDSSYDRGQPASAAFHRTACWCLTSSCWTSCKALPGLIAGHETVGAMVRQSDLLAPTGLSVSSLEPAAEIPRWAQRPGITEQEQVSHQFLEYQRLAGIEAAEVQVSLVLQLAQGFFFKHRTDFPGFPMQDPQVGMWAVQPGIDQISHGSHLLDGFDENNSYSLNSKSLLAQRLFF
jgi:hypothetical protein